MVKKSIKPVDRSVKKSKARAAAKPEIKSADGRPLIVALGASAKGLDAYERFFKHMPANTGMAFVLIQHLDPTHESLLVTLVAKYTTMKVSQVKDQVLVEKNNVYVIPPNRRMYIEDGRLRLEQLEQERGLRLPIDYFFRSLAEDAKERAVAIVLSGTGNDGALGVKEIKGQGGLALAQAPDTTEYSSMPRAAIDTGLVDMVLPPEKMPPYLISFLGRAIKAEPGTSPDRGLVKSNLERVLFLLKARTGHDFSSYKKSTLERRIERRLNVNQVEDLDDYLRFMHQNPAEVEALFRELLIGVTSFFRDKKEFEALAKTVIPMIVDERPDDKPIRVWVPGCSTGEEAYSLAILIFDRMRELGKEREVQIFATDIDDKAIEKARAGTYPDSIAADVPARLLKGYFTKEDSTYFINNRIREAIVFAVQNVIKDPPFSRLDLISCRNLLIYLDGTLHKKLVPLFHYALNPKGFLFIGTSESLGEMKPLFEQLDPKAKIYRRLDGGRQLRPDFELPLNAAADQTATVLPLARRELNVDDIAQRALLTHFTPPGVMVNRDGDIYYFHGETGPFLEPAPGKASLNVLSMARKGIKVPLANALRKAVKQGQGRIDERVGFKDKKEQREILISVAPVTEAEAGPDLFLVTFTETAAEEFAFRKAGDKPAETAQGQRRRELEHELASTREYLQTTIEELETSNEELKSTNEEYQSANEELQSTNEELQTSKEELQSVNEELITVNAELEGKIGELTKAYDDISNLLSIVEVGTLIIDTKLRIKHFTNSIKPIMSLIKGDLGRPISDINTTLKLDNNTLQKMAVHVLDKLEHANKEVETQDGEKFIMRLAPFRSPQNVIEGVVVTFTKR